MDLDDKILKVPFIQPKKYSKFIIIGTVKRNSLII